MQPDSHDDLDRTDELPQLDVAAYEARLAHGGDGPLSRTDTWAVETVQEAFLELPREGDGAVVEQDAAHGLGRNLAAKLADCEALSSQVAQRNAAIVSLEQARDDTRLRTNVISFNDGRRGGD